MYRTQTCGELRISDVSKTIKLSGWVQTTRDFGAMPEVEAHHRHGRSAAIAAGHDRL